MTRAAAIALALVCGCSYTREQVGDATFLRAELRPVEGRATAAEVATALGPPAEVRSHGEELWFIYRSRQVVEKALVLRYVLDIVRRSETAGAEDTLLLIFDGRDVLRAAAAVRTKI